MPNVIAAARAVVVVLVEETLLSCQNLLVWEIFHANVGHKQQ